MRIAYAIFLPTLDKESGVLKKILDQMAAWRSEGHELRLFAMSSSGAPLWSGLAEFDPSHVPNARPHTFWKTGRRHLKELVEWQPDLVYHRYSVWFPSWKEVLAHFPVVVEINSDDLAERAAQVGLAAQIKHRYNAATRSRMLRDAAGLVFVSRELSERFPPFGQPVLVSANGIDLKRFAATPPPDNARPRLFYLGSASALWNGPDVVLEFARNMPDWDFTVVGISEGDLPGETPANCRLCGQLPFEAYQRLLADSDVAVGTLALYRNNGMQEASPLKVREYLAAGLPAIIGYEDSDFPEPVPFLLRLPNAPGNLGSAREQVVEFVTQWKGRRVARDEVAAIDTRIKEQERLELFDRVRDAFDPG